MDRTHANGASGQSPGQADTVIDDSVLAQVIRDVGGTQAATVLLLFAGELERRVGEVSEAASGPDVEGLRRVAHGAKGSASTFGAPGVAAAARRLEEACRNAAPAARIASLADSLIAQLKPAAAEIRNRLRFLEEDENV